MSVNEAYRDKHINGLRFSKWTIIKRVESSKNRERRVLCLCDCGNTNEILFKTLANKESTQCKSCSARNNKARKTHGDADRTRLYRIWQGMKARCKYKSMGATFDRYGGRGISVCSAWEEYTSFKEWAIKNNYSDTLEIDRTDSDGNYEPSNCRWVTRKENALNKRVSGKVGFRGVRMNKNKTGFEVQVSINGRSKYLGTTKTAKDGAKLYDDYVTINNLPNKLNISKEK